VAELKQNLMKYYQHRLSIDLTVKASLIWGVVKDN